MPNFQDKGYLISKQYKDATNLYTRIQLHQRFSTNPYGWFRWVFDQFDLPSVANILEIGCGPGTLWLENTDRIPADWLITLSDLSPGMVWEAQTKLTSSIKSFKFSALTAMEIPISDKTFDAVIANHMLPHISDRQKALAEITRVLKTDGCFYAATNGENHLRELSEIINQLTRSADEYYSPSFSANEFSLENGMQQLAPWFKHIEIRRYEDSLIVTEAEPLISYIHSMIPRSDDPAGNKHGSDVHRSVNKLIDQQGSIHIQKSTGIFIGDNRE